MKQNGQLIACVLPWSPTSIKRMKVSRVAGLMKWATRILRWTGLASVKEDQSIETLYLTHLAFDPCLGTDVRAEVVSSIVHFIFANRRMYQFHMISVADGSQKLAPVLKRSFLVQRTLIRLFQVSTNPRPDYSGDEQVGFEMALV